MSKVALGSAIVSLIAVPLAMSPAETPPPTGFVPPPGAAAPWADTTTTPRTLNVPGPTKTPASTEASAPVSAAPSSTDAPSATTPIPVVTTPMQGTMTPINVVSLRAGPTGNAPVIGTLHPGDQLEILATANYGWIEVRSPAGTGWAYGSYLGTLSGH